MDFLNKTFFRFAFGFIGIILFSISMIVAVNHFFGDDSSANCPPSGCTASR